MNLKIEENLKICKSDGRYIFQILFIKYQLIMKIIKRSYLPLTGDHVKVSSKV